MSKPIQQIKAEELQPLFRGEGSISYYGDGGPPSRDFDASAKAYTHALAGAPVSRLLRLAEGLVAGLKAASPKDISDAHAQPGVTPVQILEAKIRYRNGIVEFDALMEEMPALLEAIRTLSRLRPPVASGLKDRVADLRSYIQAGEEFLSEDADLQASLTGGQLSDRLLELADEAAQCQSELSAMEGAHVSGESLLSQHGNAPHRLVAQWCEIRPAPIAGYDVPAELLANAAAVHADLLQRFSDLVESATVARERELAEAIARARGVAAEFQIQVEDIFRIKSGVWVLLRESRVVTYRNPETGQIWAGKGRVPKWLHGKDPARFAVRR